jgi:arginyl-tRNA synthetase
LRTPSEIRSSLAEDIESLLRERFGADVLVQLSEPRNRSFGDLSTQAALEAAAVCGRPPRVIAEAVRDGIALPPEISGISLAGPGFLNLTFSPEYLCATAAGLAGEGLLPLLGKPGTGSRALVEFVSSNPTGPLSVGHCRQAVLGEAVSRLLEATGWAVEREYYFNDAGRQNDLLAESLARRYAGSDEVPEGGYRGAYVLRWAEELRASRPGLSWPGDSGVFRRFATSKAMEMIMEDLALLDIRFDRFFSESSLIPEAVGRTLGLLREVSTPAGPLIYEDPPGSGKTWARLTALGRPEDRVLVRESGEHTYRMPDVAYHLDKFARGYDLMVDIFGADHLDTSQDVTALLGVLVPEADAGRLKVMLHQFVTLLREGRKVKMSTRADTAVTLRELIAEVGSPDVTRYLFLTRKAEAHMDFDLDLAVRQSDENPVYYVQYACARISGILRSAGQEGLEADPADAPALLTTPDERSLLGLLEAVPARASSAARALEPHRLTEMLHELATAFHGFYTRCRVVDPGAPGLSRARLMLCAACRNTVRDLLGILGVSAPERM